MDNLAEMAAALVLYDEILWAEETVEFRTLRPPEIFSRR